jgi:aminobenzoyl-glutamate utilization protein B
MSENVLVASQATADNLASAIGHIQYTWRAARLDSVRDVYDALAEIARHAAATTGCTPTVRWVSRLRPGLYNRPLAELVYANLATVGPPTWDAEAIEFARELERGMGIDPSPSPFIAEASKLQSPDERDAEWRAQLPPWQTHFTWDDYVEYTWHAPTARLFTAKPVLKAARSWSHWSALALNGLPAAIDPTWRTAATVMSHTLIDLIAHPGALAAAQADFVERTGGGHGGKRWLAPLHPRDFVAPVDLPWPEYVTTTRGREWWLPTPVTRGDPL